MTELDLTTEQLHDLVERLLGHIETAAQRELVKIRRDYRLAENELVYVRRMRGFLEANPVTEEEALTLVRLDRDDFWDLLHSKREAR
jgi:rRNA pseudouridine-1189 N-methylase Emg1 (Nep1/Mra1 family)